MAPTDKRPRRKQRTTERKPPVQLPGMTQLINLMNLILENLETRKHAWWEARQRLGSLSEAPSGQALERKRLPP